MASAHAAVTATATTPATQGHGSSLGPGQPYEGPALQASRGVAHEYRTDLRQILEPMRSQGKFLDDPETLPKRLPTPGDRTGETSGADVVSLSTLPLGVLSESTKGVSSDWGEVRQAGLSSSQ